MTHSRNAFRFVLLILLAAGLAACGGAEERKAKHMERGQALFAEGNYEKARLEFRNVLQIDPKDVDARFALAETLEKLQNWRAAAGHYLAVVEAQQDHVQGRVKLGRLYLLGRASDKALEMAEAALAVSPDDPDALMVRAGARVQQGDRTGAEADARAALQQAPDNTQAIALLASLEVAQGNTKEAVRLLQEGIANTPGDVTLRTVLAQLLAKQGDVEGAAKLLREAIAIQPDKLSHPLRLAALYAQAKRPDDAEAVLREAVARDPANLRPKLALVKLISDQRGPEAAEEQLLAFIKGSPDAYELRVALAGLYESTEQTEKAQSVYREIMDKDGTGPQGLAARNRLARLLVKENKLEESESLLAEVLEESPRDTDALILRGDIALAKGDVATAIADYRAVLRDRPNLGAVRRSLARAHFRNKDLELAQENLRKAVEAEPGNAQWRLELAQLYEKADQREEAIEQLQALLETAPRDARALQTLVQLQLRQKDWSAAEETAKRIKLAYPDKPLGYYVEGLIHQARGELDASVEAFELALAQAPDASDPLTAIVKTYLAQEKPEAALERLEATVKRNPESAAARNLMGEVMLVKSDFAAAESTFQQAIELNPKLPVLYRNLALARLGQENKEGAVAAYRAGLEATDGAFVLVVALATLYENTGQPDKAIAQYEGMLARAPDSELAANNLAMLLVTYRSEDAGSIDRAQELASRLSDSENPAYLDTVAWVAYTRGETDQAIELLKQALRKAPDVPVFQYHLGAAYHQKGDMAAARTYLEKAVAAKRDFPGKSEAEALLEQTKAG